MTVGWASSTGPRGTTGAENRQCRSGWSRPSPAGTVGGILARAHQARVVVSSRIPSSTSRLHRALPATRILAGVREKGGSPSVRATVDAGAIAERTALRRRRRGHRVEVARVLRRWIPAFGSFMVLWYPRRCCPRQTGRPVCRCKPSANARGLLVVRGLELGADEAATLLQGHVAFRPDAGVGRHHHVAGLVHSRTQRRMTSSCNGQMCRSSSCSRAAMLERVRRVDVHPHGRCGKKSSAKAETGRESLSCQTRFSGRRVPAW